ncbi:MAG: hypothetical protein ACREFU_00070 [Acetobacteraceae bacterium]
MTVALWAALYLRVSTAGQAGHDASIPNQKRQGEAYCQSRDYQLAETYVGPGGPEREAVSLLPLLDQSAAGRGRRQWPIDPN